MHFLYNTCLLNSPMREWNFHYAKILYVQGDWQFRLQLISSGTRLIA